MDVMRAPEGERSLERVERRNRGLAIAVAVLAVVALALGGWLAFELMSTDETAASAEVEAVLDRYTAAWNDYDGDAFLELVTPDFRHHTVPGEPGDTAQDVAEGSLPVWDQYNWQVERVGPVRMVRASSGVGSKIYASFANRLRAGTIETGWGFSVFTLVMDGDAWKIQQHVFTGTW